MGRIREFSPDEALIKSMHLFWQRGYRHTSLSNLVEETGVGKKGLYSVFGSKHELYIKAMEYYKCLQAEELLFEIEKEDASKFQIQDLFKKALKFTQGKYGIRGCMVCNAMAEFADSEPEIWKATTTHVDRFRRAFKNALINSKRKQEVNNKINADKYANYFAAVLQSLMLMSRAGTRYSTMKDTVDITLSSI